MKDMNDYLGACGLDNEPGVDETGNQTPPTWEPLDSDEFGEKVVERFRQFITQLTANGLLPNWRRNYRQYFNGPAAPGSSDSGWGWSDSFEILGANGEVLNVRPAESRTLITRMVNLACAKPVALRAVAKQATPESMEAAQIAESVLRSDFDPVEDGQITREAVELAIAVTIGWLDEEWDVFAGEAYVPTDDGGTYYSGRPKTTLRMPDEVCFDLTKRNWKDVFDCIVLQRGNRYMLASQFPDLRDEIMSVPSLHDSEFKSFRYDDENTDDIVIFRYMHKAGNKSFLPSGRLGLVLEDGTVLRDGANPYALVDPERLGIFPITAGSGLGTVYGYATMNDLSPLSQWLTVMTTMAATLVTGYGAPNLTGPNMSGMQVQAMIGGGRYFGLPPDMGEVKPLNLLDESALNAILKTMEFVIDMGEKHSGMSGLVREPGDGDSGKKVAIMKSMAVQFMSTLQQSIVAVSKARGNYKIRMREKFSTKEEVAELSSSNGAAQQVVSYKASERFPQVAKVEADAIDPVSQTIEGRTLLADRMFEMGIFNTRSAAYDYVQFIKTGRDEPLFHDILATDSLIARENQMIMKGEVPLVIAGIGGVGGDEHEIHIPKHMGNLSDPSARVDGSPVAKAALEHIARHQLALLGAEFLQGIDPMTGQEYPPAVQQFAQAQAAQRQAEAQATAMQQGPPQGSPAQTPGAPPQPGGGGAPPGQAPVTAEQAMQDAAMGPV